MIEIGGYITGAITLVLGLVVSINQRLDDDVIRVRGKIRDELKSAYEGLASALKFKSSIVVRDAWKVSHSTLRN